MSFSPWPQSLFGRLLAASVAAVLIAQVVALLLIAQEREHFMLQGSVREWTRRIAETTLMLAPLDPAQRTDALAQLMAAAPLHPPHVMSHPAGPHPMSGRGFGYGFLRLPSLTD